MTQEARPVSHQLPPRSLPWLPLGVPIAVWVLGYWSSLPQLAEHWSTEDFSYCWLVPPLFAYLLWEVRGRFAASIGGARWPGIACLALAMGLWTLGQAGALETLTYLSMWLSLFGIALAVLGAGAARPLAMPFLILLFAIPLPAFLNRLLSFRLRLWSSALAVSGLQALGVTAYREGNFIDLGAVQLQVVDACSGLRFLFPTVLMSLVIGHYLLGRKRSRLALLAFSPLVAVGANALRITLTGVLVKYVDPRLGEGFFHDFSGWLVYMFSLAGLLGIVWGLRKALAASGDGRLPTARPEPGPGASPPGRGNSAWGAASACLVLLAGGWVLQSQLLVSQIIPQRTPFTSFPTEIGSWMGEREYLPQEILNNLWADDYVTGRYRNPASGNTLQLLVSYYQLQTSQHTAHAPTSCLLGGGWELMDKRVSPPNPATGRDFPVQSMTLELAGQRILSNFWFEQRGRHITSEYMNKLYLLWDALTLRRSDGALVRVELYLRPGQSVEQGQALLDAFLGPLRAKLTDYIPGRGV
jgi:exosortase D (VPLPA-CTERM-specific)